MQTSVGIYGNMPALDTPRYKRGPAERTGRAEDVYGQQRQLLRELVSSSSDLTIRVWLDGVYTNVEDAYPKGGWMLGREVYFKVEAESQE